MLFVNVSRPEGSYQQDCFLTSKHIDIARKRDVTYHLHVFNRKTNQIKLNLIRGEQKLSTGALASKKDAQDNSDLCLNRTYPFFQSK